MNRQVTVAWRHIGLAAAAAMVLVGCNTMASTSENAMDSSAPMGLGKPGFDVSVEDGRLWVLRPGQEKSDKHSTAIGAGPRNMTVKALDDATILAYLAAKPGFETSVEERRVWVLNPGEEKSDKHSTLIGAGPLRATLKALDDQTLFEYLAAKPGFETSIEDGRIWVLNPGEEKSDKHSTAIGAGPRNMTVKALDDATLLAYLAAKPGFETTVEDGRVWVLNPGEEKSDKHSTAIGAGPMRATVKALDDATLNRYLASPGY